MPTYNMLGSYYGRGRSWWVCWGIFYDQKTIT